MTLLAMLIHSPNHEMDRVYTTYECLSSI